MEHRAIKKIRHAMLNLQKTKIKQIKPITQSPQLHKNHKKLSQMPIPTQTHNAVTTQ